MEEKKGKHYDEGEVLRDLAIAGVKIVTTVLSKGTASTNNPENSKLIEIGDKCRIGEKRWGKIDFLLHNCKGYMGVIRKGKKE